MLTDWPVYYESRALLLVNTVSVLGIHSLWWERIRHYTEEITSQSDGKCFPHKPGPSASRAHLPSASPPQSVTGKHWKNTDSSQATPGIHLRMSDVYRLNCLTSVAVIPTLSPPLNARSKFSFCKSVCVRDHFKTDFKINPEQNPEQRNTHSFETLLVFYLVFWVEWLIRDETWQKCVINSAEG